MRGRFNAAFFRLMDPVLEWSLRQHKQRVFAGLPREVVEIGSGVGANLRYLPAGATLVAIEPNRHMHGRLRDAAQRHGVHLDLHERMAEQTGLPDHSVECVISSLVLCSVQDPAGVLAEVRRILRPGGTYRFLEHVVAASRHADPGRATDRFVVRGPGPSRAARANETWSSPCAPRGSRASTIEPLPNPHPVPPVQHPHRRHRAGVSGSRPIGCPRVRQC